MAAEDWLPDCAFEDDEEPDEDEGVTSRSHPVCKYCDAKNLHWNMTPHGWRLFENGELHRCADPFQMVADLEKTRNTRHRTHRSEKAGLPHRRQSR